MSKDLIDKILEEIGLESITDSEQDDQSREGNHSGRTTLEE